MISIKERMRPTAIVNESESEKILKCIAEEKNATFEMIIERFPRIRWGDMFSIVRGFRREGLVTVHQVDTILEVRIHERTFEVVSGYSI